MRILPGSHAIAAQDYPLVATLAGNIINIYEVPTNAPTHQHYAEPSHQISLDAGFASKIKTITFSPRSNEDDRPRILLATTTTVHIYSALPEEPPFHASILNAASPSPALQCITFLSSNEVVLVPQIAPRITIRDITTGPGLELRDIKHTTSIRSKVPTKMSAYSIRPSSDHIAFLTRPNVGKDVLMTLSPRASTDGLQRTVEVDVPIATSDAQGLQFSPNGTWLAILDTPSAAHNGSVYIYTANGQLFKQWRDDEDPDLCLGVESLVWLEDGRLAIATIDGRVVILSSDTFQEEASIRHQSAIESVSDDSQIYVEQHKEDKSGTRYVPASLPAIPPGPQSTASESKPRSITHLSCKGEYSASICAETPTTVHITSLVPGCIRKRATLIHFDPIKSLEWHPSIPGWLLIRTASTKSPATETIHVWSESLPEPLISTATLPEHITKAKDSSTDTTHFPPTWAILPSVKSPRTIPQILVPFNGATLLLPADFIAQPDQTQTSYLNPIDDLTPRPGAASARHKLTHPTPIRGYGPEDAFDASFEELKAESSILALESKQKAASARESEANLNEDEQIETGSVTDAGFSPVKFDAGDWTRRQILNAGDLEDGDDTFVGKAGRSKK